MLNSIMSNGTDLHRKADTNLKKKKKNYFELEPLDLVQGYLGMQTDWRNKGSNDHQPSHALLPELCPPQTQSAETYFRDMFHILDQHHLPTQRGGVGLFPRIGRL